MKKYRVLLFIAILVAVLLTALSGCVTDSSKIPVERIILQETEVSVASHGENSVYQIYPKVYPENANNKAVIFTFADYEDTQYVTVTDTGLVTARKVKENANKEPQKVEIRIKSADNPKVYASVFFTIENRTVEKAFFSPSLREVYIDQEPFTVKTSYFPAHAAEGLEFTYTSDNTEVAEVDSSGLVTILAAGTAHIVATNTNGVSGFLEVKVRYAPPSYQLSESPGGTNAYNQIPGNPISIAYTLIPGQNNDPNMKIRWYAEGAEVVANRYRLTYNYLPSETLTPQVYNIRIELTDRDDQKQVITSKDINVYEEFSGVDGIEVDTAKTYFVSDRICLTPLLRQDEQRPESYRWYVRVLGEDEAVPANLTLDQTFTYLDSSRYQNNGGAFQYTPTSAGRQILAMSPIVNGTERKAAAVFTDVITVNLLEKGNPFHRVNFSSVTDGSNLQLKINWGYMPTETAYVVEIETADGAKTFVSSADAQYAAYFTPTSVVLPKEVITPSKSAKIRLRTDRYGYGETYLYAANSVITTAMLTAKDTEVSGVPFNYYINNMAELGDIFNYIRFFRPGQSGYAGSVEGIEYAQNADSDRKHTFRLTVAFGFDFASVKDSYKAEEFNKVSALKMASSDFISYQNGGTQEKFNYFLAQYNEAVNKVFTAFLAYSESGDISVSVVPNYGATTGGSVVTRKGTFTLPNAENQAYTVKLVVSLSDEPSELHVSTGEARAKNVSGYSRLTPTVARGNDYDNYFVKNRGEMAVENGQQLYLAASWGYKPVPKAGSVAETILNKATETLNRILGDGIVTEQQKARAIYDFLVVEINYDYQLAENAQASVYSEGFGLDGVFLRKNAVCDGLSKAFNLMAWMEGIVSFKISGAAGNAGHAWNKALLDGEWFLMDTTWGGTMEGADKTLVPTGAYALKKDGDLGFIEVTNRVTYGEYPAAKR